MDDKISAASEGCEIGMEFDGGTTISSTFGVALLMADFAQATVSQSNAKASPISATGIRKRSSQPYNVGLSAGPNILTRTDPILDRNAATLHCESLKYK